MIIFRRIVFVCLSLVVSPFVFGGVKSGDLLSISLKGVPTEEQAQVNGQYRVGESGAIKIPITGTLLKVRGLSNEQVSRKIENDFKKGGIYREPVIETIILGVNEPDRETLTVGGQVRKPGAVVWKKGMTLQQAIQLSGEKTAFGSKYVFLTRNGKKYKYDTSKLAHQSLKVYPNDTVEVKQVGKFGDW